MNIINQPEKNFAFNAVVLASMFILSVTVFSGCAAEAPASGGPEDRTPPRLESVSPSGNTLKPDESVVLTFSERIDPLSVPASVRLYPELKTRIKSRGNTVIVIPEDSWPNDSLIRFEISRAIRDYRSNRIEEPIQLVFSTGAEIPTGSIRGQLFNIDFSSQAEAGIFTYPVFEKDTVFRKIEVDALGRFQFDNIPEGNYIAVAIVGELTDLYTDIQKYTYGMMTREFIHVCDTCLTGSVEIRMSQPAARVDIRSIEFINQDFAQLVFSDGTEEFYEIPKKKIERSILYPTSEIKHSPGDTVTIRLTRNNHLEEFQLPEYSFILPSITDSIPPEKMSHSFDGEHLTVVFSEPVKEQTGHGSGFLLAVGIKDTTSMDVAFDFVNSYTVKSKYFDNKTRKIQFSGYGILDNSGNAMTDSLFEIQIVRPEKQTHAATGALLGNIQLFDESPTGVEVVDISTGQNYFSVVSDQIYQFQSLPPGQYTIWAFEIKNEYKPEIYFSGLWNPYQRAARFYEYPDTIEVRARWQIEGIDLVKDELEL